MTEMEEDKRELCLDLPNGFEIELFDATAQQEQPTPSEVDQNSAQNGQSHSSCPETNEDKDLDLRDSGDQVMRDETANGDVKAEDLKANDGQTKGDDFEEIKGNDNDAGPSEPLEESKANATESGLTRPPEESIVNGSIAHQEVCRPKADSTPLFTEKVLAPKAEDKKVEEVKTYFNDREMDENEELGASEDGTPAEQAAFMKELENFHIEKALEFKAPKFYGLPLNCLKLWRAVIRLGGYDVVTSSKLWRQVGESFHPPKTCTTVSWTFRIFYEKALLEYEKHKRQIGELQLPVGPLPHSNIADKEPNGYHTPGSGRARRDAAARAMQGWHAQRLIGYGEISEPIIKDKSLNSSSKREKSLKSIGLLKHKTSTNLEHAEKTVNLEADKQVMANIVDIGPPADWVKINVRENKDCFEVYALVPGFLREEVRVQSDPAGRLVITGQPEHLDNPWGITPFRKVVSLPARIDPLHTSAVVSLHGRLFVRVPFEQGSV